MRHRVLCCFEASISAPSLPSPSLPPFPPPSLCSMPNGIGSRLDGCLAAQRNVCLSVTVAKEIDPYVARSSLYCVVTV